VIWFNDPVLIEKGFTEHTSGHDDHLHVRYCTPAHPDPNYRCSSGRPLGAASLHGAGDEVR
jgi:hypothetical protein